jgi:hypothetical protein
MSRLEAIGGDVEGALERVNVPAYVIDASGVIRWLHAAALGIVGDVRGRQFTTVVAPEDRRLSRELFAQKVAGTVPVTDAELVLVDAHVRAVLRALGVHSRLEAVALARRRALAK